jgi:hypothetical protein
MAELSWIEIEENIRRGSFDQLSCILPNLDFTEEFPEETPAEQAPLSWVEIEEIVKNRQIGVPLNFSSSSTNNIQQEDGSYILQEDGSKILQEDEEV